MSIDQPKLTKVYDKHRKKIHSSFVKGFYCMTIFGRLYANTKYRNLLYFQ